MKSYAETTIEGSIQPRGANRLAMLPGGFSTYENTGYIADVIHEGDLVKDQQEQYYEARTVPQEWWLNQFDGYYPCEMAKLAVYPEETISLPTATEYDARSRTKVWLDTYLSLACDWAALYAYPNYPLQYEFTGANVTGNAKEDVLFCIGVPESTPLLAKPNDNIYAYNEQIPISIAVLQQFTQSDTEKLKWVAEDALRTCCRDYPYGSKRTLTHTRDKTERHGSATIAISEYILSYKRASGYVPSYPRITYGWAETLATFIFPNVVEMPEMGENKDAWLDIFGYSGSLPQGGGSKSLDIEFVCDLDIEPSTLTWKRAQAGAKTDNSNWDIFRDLWHNEGINQTYHTLTMSASGPAFYVRLVDYRVEQTADGKWLRVRFREDRETTAAAQTYKQRLGII